MSLVLFALLTVAGAWVAWRRNPLYSTWSTLRAVGVVGLAVAAVITVIVAAINLTIHKSAPVALGTMLAVVIFATLALIFLIQTMSTPRVPAVPTSVKLVNTHRQKTYRWWKRFGIMVPVVGILVVVIPGNAKYVVGAMGGIAIFLGIILLPTQYIVARELDHSLTALQFDPWIHWQYPTAQWKEWTDVQIERMKAVPPAFIWRRDWRKVAWAFGLISAGVFLFAPLSWQGKAIYVVCIFAILFGLFALSKLGSGKAAEKRRSYLLNVTPEVYFGQDGMFCDGAYTAWLSMNNYLLAASVDERQPRSLVFRFEKVVRGAYTAIQVVQVEQCVLIPNNLAIETKNDIARLQQKLSARCLKARIALG